MQIKVMYIKITHFNCATFCFLCQIHLFDVMGPTKISIEVSLNR